MKARRGKRAEARLAERQARHDRSAQNPKVASSTTRPGSRNPHKGRASNRSGI